jgi:hypothetical protein
MAENDKATTELCADSPNPKPGYFATRYKTDTTVAEREQKRARGKYKSLPDDKKAKIIAQKLQNISAALRSRRGSDEHLENIITKRKLHNIKAYPTRKRLRL